MLLHLVGFSMWIILWCTDPRTSFQAVSCIWIHCEELRVCCTSVRW